MFQYKNKIYYIIIFLQGMVFYAPAAGLYRVERGLSVFQITLIESLSLVLMIALEIPMGFLAERIGYRKTILCCNLLFFVSKLVFWRADRFALFLLERIMLSVVGAGLSGCDSAYLFACAGPDSDRAFSRYSAVQTAGVMLAALVFTFGIGGNLEESAGLTAAAYGAAAALSFLLPEAGTPKSEKFSVVKTAKLLYSERGDTLRFLLYLAACALLTQTAQTVTVFLSQLQYRRCGIETGAMGLCYLAVQGAALSAAFSHRISARLGETAFTCTLFLLSAAACVMLTATDYAALSIFCIAVLAAASALLAPSMMTVQNRRPAAFFGRAAVLSVYSMMTDGFTAGVSVVLGRAGDAEFSRAFLLGSVFCAAGLVLYLTWKRSGGTVNPASGKFRGQN
ncbi:MAG: MFS transporter [Oscillospiraceae bacterium]|nr:MFS transporter [Oscillospiraceae bacterium]